MTDYGKYDETAIARNITESYSLTPGDRATALRQMVYNSCAEVRRLMDELRVGNHLTATLTDRCRELETKGGKP